MIVTSGPPIVFSNNKKITASTTNPKHFSYFLFSKLATMSSHPDFQHFRKYRFLGLPNPVFRFAKFLFLRMSRVSSIFCPKIPDLLNPVFRFENIFYIPI